MSEIDTGVPSVAYFSMEIGLDPSIPTYSGGLGVLAGDTLRAAADARIPMVGITLLHRAGYFRQSLDATGNQYEDPVEWAPEDHLEPLTPRVTVWVEGRPVEVVAWRYLMKGQNDYHVPVYFLDTNLPENDPSARRLTDHLYGGDDIYRLSQEAVLGLGGMAMLRALGHREVQVFHLNEGHAALLALALLEERLEQQHRSVVTIEDIEAVRQRCVFTTHTPVPAGHDQFTLDLARLVLGHDRVATLDAAECHRNDMLNLTYVALLLSRYVNGVAMRHGEVAQGMFPGYPINSITNGVHATTWTSPPFQRLYDRHIPEWRHDNRYLRYAGSLSLEEIAHAHMEAKTTLLQEVSWRTGVTLDVSRLTLGFARRATAYKRADLLFADVERLRRISRQSGPMQIIFGGKAHPRDEGGKALIRRVYEAADALHDTVQLVYVQDYDMALAYLMCSGVDVWLNTPLKPLEASGTSGMKAALNGVPSLSILDGWWIEGHIEGVTGWAIGDDSPESKEEREIESLYDLLERSIVPLYYQDRDKFTEVMRSAISLNGSFFNAQRMLSQYVLNAYQTVAGPDGGQFHEGNGTRT
jgi:glycogen phosphorylase